MLPAAVHPWRQFALTRVVRRAVNPRKGESARPCDTSGRRDNPGNEHAPLDFAPGGQCGWQGGGPSRDGAGTQSSGPLCGARARGELRVAEKTCFARPEIRSLNPLGARLYPSPITHLTVAPAFSDPEMQVPHAPDRLWPAAKPTDVWPWCLPIASKGVF